jgi:hypothetical protein
MDRCRVWQHERSNCALFNIFTHTFRRHAEFKYSDEGGRKLILYIIYIDACIYI